jgi:hypothetical protein
MWRRAGEALAEQRRICVSAHVQEDATAARPHFKDLGEQRLKNIVRPVGPGSALWIDERSDIIAR